MYINRSTTRERTQGLRGNADDWAEALRESHPQLAAQLNTDRLAGFERADRLGLPTYRRTIQPLQQFLDTPAEAFSSLGSELFYGTLLPSRSELPRLSRADVSGMQLLAHIDTYVHPHDVSSYDIVIQQYFKNLFGGNIVINPSGQIYAEFKHGMQGPVATGHATPEFTVTNNNPIRAFRYSFEDEGLRRAIYGTLQYIPHYGEGRDVRYAPGYYEFALVQKGTNDIPAPIFIDYRNDPSFLLPDGPFFDTPSSAIPLQQEYTI